MALIGLPGLEVVAVRQQIKACLRGVAPDLREVWHDELLVRQHITDHTGAETADLSAIGG
jgi:hypothetical protein